MTIKLDLYFEFTEQCASFGVGDVGVNVSIPKLTNSDNSTQ